MSLSAAPISGHKAKVSEPIMTTEWSRIVTADGYPLFGLGHGLENRGVAVLYVHGLGGNGFTLFTDELAIALPGAGYPFVRANLRTADLLRIDEFPESGEVRKGGGAFHNFSDGMRDIAAWVEQIAAWGLPRVVLLGHSLGSLSATQYLAETGDPRIVGLVLASTADLIAMHEARFTEEERANFAELASELLAAGRGSDLLPPACAMGLMHQPVSAAAYLDRFGSDPSWDVMDLFERGSQRAFTALRAVHVPILAFFGSHGETVPVDQIDHALDRLRWAAQQAPSFTTATIEGANHFYTGHGQEVADVLVDWLAGHGWGPR